MSSQEKNLGVGFEKRHKTRNQSRDEVSLSSGFAINHDQSCLIFLVQLTDKQTMMVKGPDGEMIECEIVATRDHESYFTKNAPILPLPLAILCCLLNIIPG